MICKVTESIHKNTPKIYRGDEILSNKGLYEICDSKGVGTNEFVLVRHHTTNDEYIAKWEDTVYFGSTGRVYTGYVFDLLTFIRSPKSLIINCDNTWAVHNSATVDKVDPNPIKTRPATAGLYIAVIGEFKYLYEVFDNGEWRYGSINDDGSVNQFTYNAGRFGSWSKFYGTVTYCQE